MLSACLDSLGATAGEHDGRVVHTAGDAVLAEFPSIVAALDYAVAFQHDMRTRNKAVPEDPKVQFRVGINLGEVIAERDDLFGDGVNIAARVEGVAGPVHVYRVELGGGDRPAGPSPRMRQEIRFCTASDGVRIAYASVGGEPPPVTAANWLNHLEYDWESPVWCRVVHELARDHLLVRYDGYARGRYKRGKPDEREQGEAMITLMRQGWGQENPAFRQIFTSLFIPGRTQEQI